MPQLTRNKWWICASGSKQPAGKSMPRMVRIPATNASTFYCCVPKMSDACYAISADGLKQESVEMAGEWLPTALKQLRQFRQTTSCLFAMAGLSSALEQTLIKGMGHVGTDNEAQKKSATLCCFLKNSVNTLHSHNCRRQTYPLKRSCITLPF